VTAPVKDIEVRDVIVNLTSISDELVTLSAALLEVEKTLQPMERAYDEGLADFEAGMLESYQAGEGKWPSEETRERLYRRQLPQDTRQELMRYQAARKRAEKRIGSLKAASDAQRSILSALKTEMEASR
jgi:hypothetical protein